MNCPHLQLNDLPVEILIKIFKKLNNIDLLYSLTGVQGLDRLVQDKTFTETLDFVSTSSGKNHSFDERILQRFCSDILPRIQSNVRCLVLETTRMDRILRSAVYSNLTQLKIFKFHVDLFSSFCTDQLLFRSNFKKQITDLTIINEHDVEVGTVDQRTNVFIKLLDFFENLQSLNSMETYLQEHPILSLADLPPTSFASSNLKELSIVVDSFADCLCLLDGRLNQLSTFIVGIANANDHPLMKFNSSDLPQLNSFSLTYRPLTIQYDTEVVALLRRMCNLQHLTLYIEIHNRNTPVDGIQLQNVVLSHLSKLQTFVFYICTRVASNYAAIPLSNDDIQRTFTDVKFGPFGSGMNYFHESFIAYHVFSLPFIFDCIRFIGNCLTDTIFQNVTFLCMCDLIPFEHEFFLRLARCFPSLKNLLILNGKAQSKATTRSDHDDTGLLKVAQYLHLKSLDFACVHVDYVEQMLNESKTRLPRLTHLQVDYDHLTSVTNNFTRNVTRLNCMNVERLSGCHDSDDEDMDNASMNVPSEVFRAYFPSLK